MVGGRGRGAESAVAETGRPADPPGRPAASPSDLTPAAGSPAPPARRLPRVRLGTDQRIAALIGGIALAAAALFFGVVAALPTPDAPIRLPWLLWVAAFAVGESLIVHVQLRRDSYTFSLTDLVLAAALCLVQPTALITAQLTGAALALLLHRRQTGLKLAFNLANIALGDCVAVTVFAAVSHGAAWSTAWAWLAALLAVAVTTLTANLCIFAALTLSEGTPGLRQLRRLLTQSMPFALGAGTVGLLLVRTAVLDPPALVLLIPPSGLLIAAYRAYTRARQQQDNLRLLHEVTSLLYTSDNAGDALNNFLTAVRRAFRAGAAELVLLGDGTDAATVSRSHDGHQPVALLPLRQDDATRLVDCLAAGGTLTLRTGTAHSSQLDEYITHRGLKNAMASVLRTSERAYGLLLVAGRLGEVLTFTNSDLELLETFARHLATSLERGRLQQDLRLLTQLKEKLHHQAMHDALTGLPNRTLFLDRAQNALHLAARTGGWPAVLYLDLDGFKPVNDSHGHEAGDLLLQTFARRLRSCLRSADTPARLGGDEFAVLINGPIDPAGIERVIGRIRAQLAQPVDLGAGRVTTIGASIGVTIAGPATADIDTLLHQADAAMYTAKRARDGRYVLYQADHHSPDSPRPAAPS